MCAIALIAICASACSVARKATTERIQFTAYSLQDTVREQVVVILHDTMREVTTVTVRESETGDTLRITTVTDRTRASTRDRYHDIQEKVIVRMDTVYIEKDSVAVKEIPPQVRNEGVGGLFRGNRTTSRQDLIAGLTHNLKWLFFVLLAIIALIIIIRLKMFK